MTNRQRKALRLVRTVRGQLDAIARMMESDDAVQMDISNQLLASQAIIKAANKEIVYNLLETKIGEANDQAELPEKLEEVSEYIDRIFKIM